MKCAAKTKKGKRCRYRGHFPVGARCYCGPHANRLLWAGKPGVCAEAFAFWLSGQIEREWERKGFSREKREVMIQALEARVEAMRLRARVGR